jgi:peptidoglycan/xylan/chitin deacetylase (PgdA/CDA1 family)
MRTRHVAKSLLARAAWHSGALFALTGVRRALAGPQVHLLGFHRIVDEPRALPPGVIPSLAISTAAFVRLLLLAVRHFDILPLEQAAEVLAGVRPARRDILALTFDDGYRDVYLRARPILRDLGLPATVFVPTGFIGSSRPLPHDRLYALLDRACAARLALGGAPAPRLLRLPLAHAESLLYREGPLAALEHLIAALPAAALARIADALDDLLGPAGAPLPDDGARVMSAAELVACADAGLTLGAHTVDHVVLTHEPPARVRRELHRPRRDLESLSGRPCRAFAYCNGYFNPGLVEAVRHAGYTVAVTTDDAPNRPGQDPLALGRKVLWDGHTRGLTGRYSEAATAAHLHDLFGALRPRRAPLLPAPRWRRRA